MVFWLFLVSESLFETKFLTIFPPVWENRALLLRLAGCSCERNATELSSPDWLTFPLLLIYFLCFPPLARSGSLPLLSLSLGPSSLFCHNQPPNPPKLFLYAGSLSVSVSVSVSLSLCLSLSLSLYLQPIFSRKSPTAPFHLLLL